MSAERPERVRCCRLCSAGAMPRGRRSGHRRMPDGEPGDGSRIAALTAQLLGLGRDVDSLRRVVDRHDRTLRTVAGRLTDLDGQILSSAAALAAVSEQIADLAGGEQGSGIHRSWFDTTDPTQAQSRLVDLVHWLDRVYFQFPDGV